MLRHLLLGSNTFFNCHIQYCFEGPKILISHDATEAFFRSQESTGHPAQNHRRILPATDSVSSHAYAGVRTFDHVGRRQAAMQTGRQLEPVDREALLQAL